METWGYSRQYTKWFMQLKSIINVSKRLHLTSFLRRRCCSRPADRGLKYFKERVWLYGFCILIWHIFRRKVSILQSRYEPTWAASIASHLFDYSEKCHLKQITVNVSLIESNMPQNILGTLCMKMHMLLRIRSINMLYLIRIQNTDS